MSIKLNEIADPKLRRQILQRMAEEDSQTLSGAGGAKDGYTQNASVLLDKAPIAACRRKKNPKPRMNKLEFRFYAILKSRFPNAIITPQFRLRISAWDAPVLCFYTADFLVSEHGELGGWYHNLWEVKDSRRKPHSDEFTRAKMARRENFWISAVNLAVWNGAQWKERIIA